MIDIHCCNDAGITLYIEYVPLVALPWAIEYVNMCSYKLGLVTYMEITES